MAYNRIRDEFRSTFTAGYDITSSAGLAGLPARAQAERRAVERQYGEHYKMFRPLYTYCPNGLIALSDKGLKVFTDAHPGVVPHNLYKAGPAGQGYYTYNLECTLEKQEELVSAHARFGGWMAKAAEVPLVVRAIKESVSSRETGSRRTYVDLWSIAAKYNSPHTLKRRILAVRSRALAILAAYDGRGVSLRSIMVAVAVTRQTGKAALIAAYRSLTGKSARSYREAREGLIAMRGYNTRDERDGVTVYRTEAPALVKFGISVYSTLDKGKGGWKRGWLMVRNGRSYHLTEGRHGFAGTYVGGKYRNTNTPKGAIYAALTAWQKADEAAVLAKEKFKHLLRPDVTILVTRDDSYQAGNCSAGTASWISSTGIGRGRWCVPASALLARADERRVANVLAVANQAAGEWLARIAA